MNIFRISAAMATILLALTTNVYANDDGIAVDQSKYANRQVLPDFTAAPCPDNPRGLTQIKGNLYRHTTGAGLVVHTGAEGNVTGPRFALSVSQVEFSGVYWLEM